MKNLIIVLCLFLFPPLFFETYVSAAEGPVDMVYVPSGYSMMGTEYGDLSAEITPSLTIWFIWMLFILINMRLQTLIMLLVLQLELVKNRRVLIPKHAKIIIKI